MSPKKEQQFKLNYLDIVKGVLFPNAGKPAPKPSPKPAQAALPTSGATSQPAAQPAASTPAAQPASQKPASRPGPSTIKTDKLAPAFFNIAGILSFIVNLILIVVLVILARELFALKALVGDHLLGGLYENFILMDMAHIKTEIQIDRQIPVEFDLPISQDTVVTLTEPTRINGAQVVINSGGLSINAPANIVLPAGTNLPVHLELTVPVKTEIPINFPVEVDIPLQETELHQPFIGLQDVVRPLYNLLNPELKSAENLPCGPLRPVCNWFFYK